jgi:hypothetical protein
VTIVAFAGPSLPAEARQAFPGVDWRPPAAAGDLLHLNLPGGSTVCLIDGYFDHRPAVRHKEILLLLSEGVRILGAGSIGALRAAEMSPQGMIGIGPIHRAYARGTIKGDDEVALIHAPAELGWRPMSVPLVDVRATLCRALRESVLQRAEARALLQTARSIHYVDRDWPLILKRHGGSPRLETWLPTGQVDQKKLDALACLRAAHSPVITGPRPQMVRTRFLDLLANGCGIDLETRFKQAHTAGAGD